MFENPSISTIGAGIIINHEDKVLLVQINYGKAKGRWILPGGMVEKTESPERAALRELTEETGLEAEVESLVCYRHRKENRNENDANIYFVFSGNLLKKYKEKPEEHFQWPPEEIIEARFWPLAEALKEESIQPATRLFLRIYKESSAKLVAYPNPNIGRFEDSVFGGKITI